MAEPALEVGASHACRCDVCIKTTCDQSGPQVLTRVTPYADESLVGLLTRSAQVNYLRSIAPLIGSDRPHEHSHQSLAVRTDLDFAQMAFATRLHACEIEARRYPAVQMSGKVRCIDFHGATAPAYDLVLSTRRGAPSWLVASSYHSALGHHGLVTHCPKSGDLLTDRCRQCGAAQRWNKTHLVTCQNCDELQSKSGDEAPSEYQQLAAKLMIELIHPDPELHLSAMAAIPSGLANLNRGAIFELGWRIGAILSGHGGARRSDHKKLPVDRRLQILDAGSNAIRTWPEVVREEIRKTLEKDGGPAAAKLIKSLAVIGTVNHGWPALAKPIEAAMPSSKTYAGKVKSLVNHGSNAREVERALGVCQEVVMRLRKAGKLPLIMSSVKTHSREIYEGGQLAELRELFADRMQLTGASERLGISRNGAEQLICLGLLEILDQDVMRVAFTRSHIRRSKFLGLIERLRMSGQDALVDPIPIHSAMMMVGGRSKPWGPAIQAMLEGTLTFRIGVDREGQVMNGVTLERAEARALREMDFNEADYPDSTFDTFVNARDAEKLLNLKPPRFWEAVKAGELPSRFQGRYRRADILGLAERFVSGGEILARWSSNGREMPAPLRGPNRLRRQCHLGWNRAEVETALNV